MTLDPQQILPDAEKIISAGLRLDATLAGLLGGRIYGALPKRDRVYPLCRLARIGGGPTGIPVHLDRVLMQFDIWGGSKAEARVAASTLQAVLVGLVGYTTAGGYISGASPGAMRYIPDETFTPERPRYIVDATVYVRSTPA
jgi:hypothetical protein